MGDGDAGYASSTVLIASETQVKPFDLKHQILQKRSRRSEGGHIVQELNSIREGKSWDHAKGGWLDPVLVRNAREEEMQHVKKHAVHDEVPMSQCWKETVKNTIKTGWADTNKGNVRVSEHKISVGREGIQHRTQARLVQCNVTSGGSEARHLGGSVKATEGNSALGD